MTELAQTSEQSPIERFRRALTALSQAVVDQRKLDPVQATERLEAILSDPKLERDPVEVLLDQPIAYLGLSRGACKRLETRRIYNQVLPPISTVRALVSESPDTLVRFGSTMRQDVPEIATRLAEHGLTLCN